MSGLLGVGDEHVLPPDAVGRFVAGVEHPAREILEEDPRVDVVFDLLGDDFEGDLPEGLIGVGMALIITYRVAAAATVAMSRTGRSSR